MLHYSVENLANNTFSNYNKSKALSNELITNLKCSSLLLTACVMNIFAAEVFVIFDMAVSFYGATLLF